MNELTQKAKANVKISIETGALTPYEVISLALTYLRNPAGLDRDTQIRIIGMLL